MHVTYHAADRIADRLTKEEAAEVLRLLSREYGQPGTVAYIAAKLGRPVLCEDGSNGDTLVAVAVDGSVETIMFRRSWNQSLSPKHFGAKAMRDLTTEDDPRAEYAGTYMGGY